MSAWPLNITIPGKCDGTLANPEERRDKQSRSKLIWETLSQRSKNELTEHSQTAWLQLWIWDCDQMVSLILPSLVRKTDKWKTTWEQTVCVHGKVPISSRNALTEFLLPDPLTVTEN